MNEFDPTDYQFIPDMYYNFDKISIWVTQLDDISIKKGYVIGAYKMIHYKDDNTWDIEELSLKNKKDYSVLLYRGKIPNAEFGYQLLKNMELDIPILKRERLINKILK